MFPGPLLCFLRLVSSDNEAAARATVSQQPAHVCPSWLANLDLDDEYYLRARKLRDFESGYSINQVEDV